MVVATETLSEDGNDKSLQSGKLGVKRLPDLIGRVAFYVLFQVSYTPSYGRSLTAEAKPLHWSKTQLLNGVIQGLQRKSGVYR